MLKLAIKRRGKLQIQVIILCGLIIISDPFHFDDSHFKFMFTCSITFCLLSLGDDIENELHCLFVMGAKINLKLCFKLLVTVSF